jgi:hypothetical protein
VWRHVGTSSSLTSRKLSWPFLISAPIPTQAHSHFGRFPLRPFPTCPFPLRPFPTWAHSHSGPFPFGSISTWAHSHSGPALL